MDTIEKFANDLQGGLARVAGHPVSYRDTQFSRPAGSPLVTAIHHWAERELAAARTPDVRAFLSQFTEGARKLEESPNSRFLADLEELRRLVGEYERRKPDPSKSGRSYAHDRRPAISSARSTAFDAASFPLCAEYLPDSNESAGAAIVRLETGARAKSKPAIKGYFSGLRLDADALGPGARVRDLKPASVEGTLNALVRFGALCPPAPVLEASNATVFSLSKYRRRIGKGYRCES